MKEIDVDSRWIGTQLKAIGTPTNVILVENYLLLSDKGNWQVGMDEILAKVLSGEENLALIVNATKSVNHQAIAHWLLFSVHCSEGRVEPVRIYDSLQKNDHGEEEIAAIIHRVISKLSKQTREKSKETESGEREQRAMQPRIAQNECDLTNTPTQEAGPIARYIDNAEKIGGKVVMT